MATARLFHTTIGHRFIVRQASGITTDGLLSLEYHQSGVWHLIDVMRVTALAAVSACDDMNVTLVIILLVRKASRCCLLCSCAISTKTVSPSPLLYALTRGGS